MPGSTITSKMRRTIGFTRSVFVQPTIYGTDHSFFKDTLRAVGESGVFAASRLWTIP